MTVLDRYIVSAILRRFALSLLVLTVLAALFLFVNEQGWVGAGSYGQLAALRFVLGMLPVTVLQFLPVAALLGALLAVGELARGSELTVMRAAGVSVARIAGSVALAGLVLVPLALALAQWLAPPLAQGARLAKVLERNGSLGLSAGSAWVRDGDTLVRADSTGRLTLFTLAAGRLAAVTSAAEATTRPDGSMPSQQALRIRFDGRAAVREDVPDFVPGPGVNAEFLDLAAADPRHQSLTSLWRSAGALQAAGREARPQQLALWAGIARIAAIPLAMLLSVPLLLGFMRAAGSGARASLGLLLGLFYFIAERTVENGTLAFGLDPALAAWLPVLLLAATVAVLLARTRRL